MRQPGRFASVVEAGRAALSHFGPFQSHFGPCEYSTSLA
jgi:hypothetical protein